MTLTGHDAYLRYELFWAVPVIALQWLAARRELWRWRRLLLAAVTILTLYLSFCDAFALESGIWRVDSSRVVGLYFRHLPLEECVFYFVTSIMAAQGFVMLAGWVRERGKMALTPPAPSPKIGRGGAEKLLASALNPRPELGEGGANAPGEGRPLWKQK